MAALREFFQNLLYQIPKIGISDIVDILVVSIIFYPSDGRTESLYIKLDPQQDP